MLPLSTTAPSSLPPPPPAKPIPSILTPSVPRRVCQHERTCAVMLTCSTTSSSYSPLSTTRLPDNRAAKLPSLPMSSSPFLLQFINPLLARPPILWLAAERTKRQSNSHFCSRLVFLSLSLSLSLSFSSFYFCLSLRPHETVIKRRFRVRPFRSIDRKPDRAKGGSLTSWAGWSSGLAPPGLPVSVSSVLSLSLSLSLSLFREGWRENDREGGDV